MKSVCDFKFTIPPYAPVLSTAYEKMSRNNYLLTVVLLCQVHTQPGHIFRWDVQEMVYRQYTFRKPCGSLGLTSQITATST
ncbi:hypothetical protein BDV38DRAFT_252434 [Aspergillus pseudotamarii]|uniref:Uncharacterized protein n=1 Tax=Aspergillus pseudotamarii TaxID=132259 RepID=A0A5N6SP43_ASPPS|nr:uncharacterized protein BDV38DRAFT_252434 [Aspergillus pseudotamarii]KAE8135491.1 hypothetical protein BDV38DRAFT_252434 [Aspergillus pseudotamarii]